jgi:DNA polymerase-3 subunit alpha
MKKLTKYLDENLIKYTYNQNIQVQTIEVDGLGLCLLVDSDKERVIKDDFELNLHDHEMTTPAKYLIFRFGENYFYTPVDSKLQLIPLKYIGAYNDRLKLKIPIFLGVHGGYELLSGSRDYDDWIKKAKFLGVDILGLVEKNTLAGALKFQLVCQKDGIKSVVGEQVVVKDGEELLQFKLYVKNKMGWENLLSINKSINVDNHGRFVEREFFMSHLGGLSVVVDTKYTSYDKVLSYDINVDELYYQIDSVEFSNNEKDKGYLLNLGKFLSQDSIKPILISDAYYLDRQDVEVKEILNNISGIRNYKSEDQYFKSLDQIYDDLRRLFGDEDKFLTLFEESITNLFELANSCRFKIETSKKFLPKYIMTDEEIDRYGDCENMFWSLIGDGLIRIDKQDDEKYLTRINEEYQVISLVQSEFGNGIDYFLISWDILRFAKEQGILMGLARGSAAGSLIAYLLQITRINPFNYDLLFSRFLNKGRVERGSLPDFDIDAQTLRRDEIKRYLEEKYGVDQVCSVGTYATFQMRAAFKDIAKQRGVEFSTANYISEKLDKITEWQDIFRLSLEKPVLKRFVLDHPDVIQDIQLILRQPRSVSVHACAMIITPDNKDIYSYIPVRVGEVNDERMIVSEWEGEDLETAGFLKVDVLGITQLDKYAFIVDLIKKHLNEEVDIYSISLDEGGVYDLFSAGHNGDVFQFGTSGLTGYCRDLKPQTIDDLIAGVALYRPGAMDVNAHNEYVLRKDGSRDVSYHWGCENILKNTYGLIVYQEQVMQVVSKLGEFNEIEADDVRRAMGKKKKEIIEKYRSRFIKSIIKKGCSEDEANKIWHELEVHSGYSFNRSHAAAYAITGYIGQWLKHKYPLQYWTSAFQFANPNPKKSNINRYISEIKHTDNFIKIMPPDINESGDTFTSNHNKMEIYWSINRVKQLGEKALEAIISERNENGSFFSFEEFVDRIDKRVVNKAVVINLILSGSFDDLEGINSPEERKRLVKQYFSLMGKEKDIPEEYLSPKEDYWWQIRQKEVSGFGDIDYKQIIKDKTDLAHEKYVSLFDVEDIKSGKSVVVAGIITNVIIRTTKRGDEFCRLMVDNNNEEMEIVLWSETFSDIDLSLLSEGSIFAMSGSVVDDNYKKKKVIHSNESTRICFV